ncbi:MAG: hypothetical protein AAB552_02030 [Patescibacteria group bacterium]
MYEETAPKAIHDLLGGEAPDFIVKSKRAFPSKKSFYELGFGTFWLGFTSIFVYAFLGPVLLGKEVHFTANGVATVAGPDNLGPLIFPILIIGLFVLVGVGIVGHGLYLLRAKGAWYAGTAKKLVIYKKNKNRTISWEQFAGDVEMVGDSSKGGIALQMRTGAMVNQGKSGSRYVPDTLYIVSIKNASQVAQTLRKRIEENAPTLPKAT